MSVFDNKHILITGAAGTVGKELVRQLSEEYKPAEIRAIDNNESGLFFLEQAYQDDNRISCFLGDVRDRDTLTNEMQGIDIVIHTAALKHVILCEKSPWDAVETNISAIHNLIQAASTQRVERVLFTSSDKAVNPTNVMGTSKLMGERLITAANAKKFNGHGPIFFSTRFGNVLGSSGSVIPVFKQQIAAGGPITVTDRRMTRFIMTLSDAVSLVLKSAEFARGGEVFIPKMPVVKIDFLAEVMVDQLAILYNYRPSEIKIKEVGSKPGEKLYEELMNYEETRRAVELENMFVVLPAFRSIYEKINYQYESVINKEVIQPYNSSNEEVMEKEKLADYLIKNKLI